MSVQSFIKQIREIIEKHKQEKIVEFNNTGKDVSVLSNTEKQKVLETGWKWLPTTLEFEKKLQTYKGTLPELQKDLQQYCTSLHPSSFFAYLGGASSLVRKFDTLHACIEKSLPKTPVCMDTSSQDAPLLFDPFATGVPKTISAKHRMDQSKEEIPDEDTIMTVSPKRRTKSKKTKKPKPDLHKVVAVQATTIERQSKLIAELRARVKELERSQNPTPRLSLTPFVSPILTAFDLDNIPSSSMTTSSTLKMSTKKSKPFG